VKALKVLIGLLVFPVFVIVAGARTFYEAILADFVDFLADLGGEVVDRIYRR
jgi:hypothetical protein